MRQIAVFVEADVGMAEDRGTAAWTFDLDLWGRCGQGPDEQAALTALAGEIGTHRHAFLVSERIRGDEQAFDRDCQPASRAERAATQHVLAKARRQTVELVTASSASVLDFDAPDRTMPDWATWRTIRQMAWHLADTESRYYLPSLGLPARVAESDLLIELAESARHVHAAVASIAPDLIRRSNGQVWTTVKVLRRLAWHERSELVTMRALAREAIRRLGDDPGPPVPP